MQIILVKQDIKRGQHYTPVSPLQLFLVCCIGAIFAIVISYIAFEYGKKQDEEENSDPTNTLALQVSPQKNTPLSMEEYLAIQQQINVLSLHLGRIQADMIQLDELGKELVSIARLDNKEFDFTIAWEEYETPSSYIDNPPSEEELKLAKLRKSIKTAKRQVKDRKEKFSVLESLLLKEHLSDKILPAGWPLKQGYISSKYGWRTLYKKRRLHKGMDIVAPRGTPIYAVEAGKVIQSGYVRGYGKLVEIRHSKTYTTRYAHNSRNLVKVGATIKKGQIIARVGSTGRSTGAHLHFEILQQGKAINPVQYLSVIGQTSLAGNTLLQKVKR